MYVNEWVVVLVSELARARRSDDAREVLLLMWNKRLANYTDDEQSTRLRLTAGY